MIDLNEVNWKELYSDQKLSLRQIGLKIGINSSTVLYYLRKNEIKRRVRINENKCIGCKKKINNRNKRCIGCERERRHRENPRCKKCTKEISLYATYCRKCRYVEFRFSEESKKRMSQTRKGRFKGEKNPNFKKRKKTSHGYILVYDDMKQKHVYEHRKIMEEKINRKLEKKEEIHHINEKKEDNRIENLRLMTRKEHRKLHIKQRWKNGFMPTQPS